MLWLLLMLVRPPGPFPPPPFFCHDVGGSDTRPCECLAPLADDDGGRDDGAKIFFFLGAADAHSAVVLPLVPLLFRLNVSYTHPSSSSSSPPWPSVSSKRAPLLYDLESGCTLPCGWECVEERERMEEEEERRERLRVEMRRVRGEGASSSSLRGGEYMVSRVCEGTKGVFIREMMKGRMKEGMETERVNGRKEE